MAIIDAAFVGHMIAFVTNCHELAKFIAMSPAQKVSKALFIVKISPNNSRNGRLSRDAARRTTDWRKNRGW
jgi:hypothetical protein